MSAGRGTPRINPVANADPIVANVSSATGMTYDLEKLGNGGWIFTITPSQNDQVLGANFADWVNGDAISAFNFPKGATRGLLIGDYDPNAGTSQLELEIVYRGIIQSSGQVFALLGTPSFPNGDDPLAGSIVAANTAFQTQANNSGDQYNFGLPFIIPPGGPETLAFRVRELNSVGGSFNVLSVKVDNL